MISLLTWQSFAPLLLTIRNTQFQLFGANRAKKYFIGIFNNKNRKSCLSPSVSKEEIRPTITFPTKTVRKGLSLPSHSVKNINPHRSNSTISNLHTERDNYVIPATEARLEIGVKVKDMLVRVEI